MVTANVKLGTVVQKTDPYALGVVSSTYGASPVSDTTLAKYERALDARYVRIPVRWNGSAVVSSASGSGVSNIKQLVDLYRSWGYHCLIVIAGRSSDWDNYQNGDATQIIHTLGTTGIDYQSPNEPNNAGHAIAEVVQRAQQIQRELAAVTAGTKLWGPVWSYYDRNALKTFAQSMGINAFGGTSYHHYAMGSNSISTGQAMSETGQWSQEVSDVRSDLRGLSLPENVVVDELNFSWRYDDGTPGGNNRFFTAINTVWQASVLGHVLRAGGRGMPYATQNGPLGVLVEAGNTNPDNRPGGTPMPAYWGIAAWTGADLFPHFKDAFYDATVDDSLVEVYVVSNESGGLNVVCINKDENNDKSLTVNLGLKGTYDRWQSDRTKPYDALAHADTGKAFDNSIAFTLPHMSVATLVVTTTGSTATAPSTGTTTPAPAPSTPPTTTTPTTSGTILHADNAAASGGQVGTNAGTVTSLPSGVTQAEYASERYGTQTWTLTVPTAGATVDLLFAEKYTGITAAGQRVFNIVVNGVIVAKHFDVFKAAGARNVAVTKTVELSGGVTKVTVQLQAVTGTPFINSIRIR